MDLEGKKNHPFLHTAVSLVKCNMKAVMMDSELMAISGILYQSSRNF